MLAETSRFDIYFLSDLEDVCVPRSIINACVYELDKDGIRAVIEKVNNQNMVLCQDLVQIKMRSSGS